MVAVTEVKQKLMEAGFQAHEKEIVKLAIGLGFTVVYPHNKAHELIESAENIIENSARLGLIPIL